MKNKREDMFAIFGHHMRRNVRLFDGEPPAGDPPAGDESVVLMPVKDPSTGKVTYKTADGKPFFTQEHLNTLVGDARVTARKQVEGEKSEIQRELEKLRAEAQDKGLNVDALNQRIKEMEEANMTAEQLSERRVNDLTTQFKDTEKKLLSERDKAMALFTEEKIGTEIIRACAEHKAISADQIGPLIRGNTELVPQLNSKKEITGYKAIVRFNDRDEEGKEVTRELSISDAVKRMREMDDRYGNLFLNERESGSGASGTLFNNGGGGTGGGGKVPTPGKMSQAEWNAYAEANGL